MKRKALADYSIDCVLYPVDIGVFKKKKQYIRWRKERKLEINMDGVGAQASECGAPDGQSHFIAYIPDSATESMIAHEAVHLAMFILDWVGVKVDAENHEALAYLVEHIVRNILIERDK